VFRHVCEIRIEGSSSGEPALDYPAARYARMATARVHRYGDDPFCRFQISRNLPVSGVYLLLIAGALRYVGKCDNLSARFNMGYGRISPRNCYEGGQRTNCKVNRLILAAAQRGERVDLWFLKTDSAGTIERALIDRFRPAWNGQVTL
jgi:hypothetical protein